MNQLQFSAGANGPGLSASGTVVKNVRSFSLDLNTGIISVTTEDGFISNFTTANPFTLQLLSGVLGTANINFND